MTPNHHPQAESGSAEAHPHRDAAESVDLVEEDLLVADVSIDGMCGVY